jgi:hypothetical protein
MRITLLIALPVIAVSLATSASSSGRFHVQQPGALQGRLCAAFIETARPGGNVTVPYGDVYRTLTAARRDALNRCGQTNLAQEGWGPCRTWCEQVAR